MAQPLILPDMVYDCVSCGKSCTAFEVEITSEERERLRHFQITQELERSGFHPLRVVESGRLFLEKLDQGRCTYLSPETRCRIHETEGYAAKPLPCKDFPFHAKLTPDGVYIGLSFTCTAVAQGLGRPLEEHRQELTARFGGGEDAELPGADNSWPLWGEIAVDWGSYKRIEGILSEYLRDRGSVGLLIGAARLAQTVREGDPHLFTGSAPIGGGLGQAADGLLCGLLTLTESAGESQERTQEVLTAFHSAGKFTSSVMKCAVDLDALPTPPAWFEEQSQRYLEHLIFRKALLEPPDILSRVCLLPLVAHALRFYTQALGQRSGREPELVDFHEALTIVEGRLMLHARGMDSYYTRIGRIFMEQA